MGVHILVMKSMTMVSIILASWAVGAVSWILGVLILVMKSMIMISTVSASWTMCAVNWVLLWTRVWICIGSCRMVSFVNVDNGRRRCRLRTSARGLAQRVYVFKVWFAVWSGWSLGASKTLCGLRDVIHSAFGEFWTLCVVFVTRSSRPLESPWTLNLIRSGVIPSILDSSFESLGELFLDLVLTHPLPLRSSSAPPNGSNFVAKANIVARNRRRELKLSRVACRREDNIDGDTAAVSFGAGCLVFNENIG